MCCNKSWVLWVGLIGVVLGVGLLRTHHNALVPPVAAQPATPFPGPNVPPPPPEAGKSPASPLGPGRPRTEEQSKEQPRVNDVKFNVNVGVPGLKPKPTVVFQTKADGYGVDNDDAARDAIETARDKVAEFLATKYGETLTPKRLETLAQEIKNRNIVEEAQFDVNKQEVTGKMLPVKATVDVKLTDENVREFRKEAREDRQRGRMYGTGVVLAALISLLLVCGGYLRLEEATKGYYTTLLRVGALSLLTAIAAGIYMLWS